MVNQTVLTFFTVLAFASITLAQEPKAGDIRFEPTVYEPASGDPVEAELGTFWVPANRSNPDTDLYKLCFIRFKSTSENPGPPIIYLAGGPGGSGIESARGGRFPLFMAMREFGDVIALEQRGTGISTPRPIINFSMDYPLDQPIDFDVLVKPVIARAKAELDKVASDGIDLRSFNTEESADDLNDLRIALGAEKMSLWGISYGSHLGLSAIRRHGAVIHKVMLGGLEGPDQSVKLPSDQEALLVDIAQRVKVDPVIGEYFPDLMGRMKKVLADLEREPVMVRAYDSASKKRVEVMVDKYTMQFHTASLLGTTASSKTIPRLYYRASQGDFKFVANSALRIRRGANRQYVMSLLMDCASGATEARLERIEQESKETLLGQTINYIFPDICGACGDIDLGDDFRSPIESDVAILFISGTLVGRTSVANAVELIPGFKNSHHLVIDGAGHSD